MLSKSENFSSADEGGKKLQRTEHRDPVKVNLWSINKWETIHPAVTQSKDETRNNLGHFPPSYLLM